MGIKGLGKSSQRAQYISGTVMGRVEEGSRAKRASGTGSGVSAVALDRGLAARATSASSLGLQIQ